MYVDTTTCTNTWTWTIRKNIHTHNQQNTYMNRYQWHNTPHRGKENVRKKKGERANIWIFGEVKKLLQKLTFFTVESHIHILTYINTNINFYLKYKIFIMKSPKMEKKLSIICLFFVTFPLPPSVISTKNFSIPFYPSTLHKALASSFTSKVSNVIWKTRRWFFFLANKFLKAFRYLKYLLSLPYEVYYILQTPIQSYALTMYPMQPCGDLLIFEEF